jgi:NOL1/NOP2/sun family putative RNA methylase
MANALPISLINSLRGIPGFDEQAFLKAHEDQQSLTSIRVNPSKVTIERLSHLPISHAVPWCANGFQLAERPSFTLDPFFHAGAYYVQEASSMFLELVMKTHAALQEPMKVLDCCAAPGGKSTHLQSMISQESLLVSNEVIKTRVPILVQNITKWGASNVVVTSNDPRDFQRLGPFFDVVVVDAPCSGSGLFRKDPDAITHWNESLVEMCASRQQRILQDIWPCLKPGGLLIYSTCSYSVQEDEMVLDDLLTQRDADVLQVPISNESGIVETRSPIHGAYGYRFYPHQLQGEGFFIAAIRKNVNTEEVPSEKKKQSSSRNNKSSFLKPEMFSKWLQKDLPFIYLPFMKEAIALHQQHVVWLQMLKESCYIRKAGINIGTIAHDDLIPSHELAMCTHLCQELPVMDLDLENALQYLRLQQFEALNKNDGKGWKIIRYEACNLGWIKALPNRINNYFPRDWRILNK